MTRLFWKALIVGLGIAQIWALSDGLQERLEWSALPSVALAIVIGWIPLIGTFGGVWGAQVAWNWSLLSALSVFIGIPLIGVVMVFGAAAFSRDRGGI